MPADRKHLYRELTRKEGEITHAKFVANGFQSKPCSICQHRGLLDEDPNHLALTLFSEGDPRPIAQLYNWEVSEGDLSNGELHIPNRDMTITFLHQRFDAVPIKAKLA